MQTGRRLLPHISALATEDATQKIRLYRSDDVHVDLEGLPSTADPKLDSPGPPPSQWSARPVATCYLESGSATARIVVKPITVQDCWRFAHEPFTRKRCLVGELSVPTLGRRGRFGYFAECELPNTCTGPFEVQSAPSGHERIQTLGRSDRHTVCPFCNVRRQGRQRRLANSFAAQIVDWNDDFRASNRCRIARQRPSLYCCARFRRFASRHLVGNRRSPGTVAAETPQSASRRSLRPKVVRSRQRSISSRQSTIGRSRGSRRKFASPIPRSLPTTSGAQRITTRLILAPHGLTDCTLQLPPNQSLVTVELDGRPAVIRQLDQSQWQVALGATQLPQSYRDHLSLTGQRRATTASRRLQRPTLLAHGEPIRGRNKPLVIRSSAEFGVARRRGRRRNNRSRPSRLAFRSVGQHRRGSQSHRRRVAAARWLQLVSTLGETVDAARTRNAAHPTRHRNQNALKARSRTPPKTRSLRPPPVWTNGSTTAVKRSSVPNSE